jgi:antitoxin (DNA-binding transcriptional repressor) of toxin-antitoxin stability system
MVTVTIEEAEKAWENLVQVAENGEAVVITRNGLPIADLVRHEGRASTFLL